MRFSDKYKLIGGQAELDFVDISLETDIRLFIDPYALTRYPTEWCKRAHETAHNYFQKVLTHLKNGDRGAAEGLVDKLREDNRTRLGYSKKKPHGTGMGPKKASPFLDTLEASEAYKTGNLEDIADFSLFVRDVGPDTVSDMLTNVIRGLLVEYTVDQCRFHGVPLTVEEDVLVWDMKNGWETQRVMLPASDQDTAILLVPRAILRQSFSIHTDGFIQEIYDEYDAGNQSAIKSLEEMFQTVPTRGKKKKQIHRNQANAQIKQSGRSRKDFAAKFAAANPESVKRYRRKVRAKDHSVDAASIEKGRKDSRESRVEAVIREMYSAKKNAPEVLDAVDTTVGALLVAMHPIVQYPRLAESVPSGFRGALLANSATDGSWNPRNNGLYVLVLSTTKVLNEAAISAADLGLYMGDNNAAMTILVAPSLTDEVRAAREKYAKNGIRILTSDEIGDVLAEDLLPEDAAERLSEIAGVGSVK